MSTVKANYWQNTSGVLRTTVLQTQYVSSGTRVTTTHSANWVEPSSSYRVTITPQFSNSMIIVTYFVPFNQASAANILTNIRSFRSISGIKNYIVTSAGNANGSRWQIAGGTIRPGNGYDSNDMNKESWTVVDYPGIAGTAIDYGFESRPEGANTTYWGYSGSDNNSWGWDADIVIVAQEIAQ